MTNRDNPLWLKFWRDQRSDFHQEKVNALLKRFWPAGKKNEVNRVLVPLCGKSLDMVWLKEQGYDVIGVELSPIAVAAFFKENRMKPTKRNSGSFTLWQSGKISILCGDFFNLRASDLANVNWVYDRAALTAFPEDIRALYVKKLTELMQENSKILLLTTEDAEPHLSLEQALGIDAEITTLYASGFDIQLTHVESVSEPADEQADALPIRTEYKAYWMSRK